MGQVVPGTAARAAGSLAAISSRASCGQYCSPASYSRWQAGQTLPGTAGVSRGGRAFFAARS